MDRAILSPSKTNSSPPEKTLKLLHDRLDQAENEAKKLSEHLSRYGFKSDIAKTPSNTGRRSVIETIAPFEVDKYEEGKYEILKNNYQELVSRVCRTESIVHSLKLALVSLEAEKTLMNKDSVAGTLSANESYEKELKKLKKDLVNARKTLDESERFRVQTELDFQKLRDILNIKSGSNVNVVEKVKELKATSDRLTIQINELREQLSHEKGLRENFEDSHEDLLSRVAEMEKLVERENQEMKLFSGDCARLKKELNKSRTQYNREYQTRMQLENLVERLKHEADEMESKLLNISNERKDLDSNISKIKRENKELRQQLENVRKSSETLKEVNLDLEKRFKGTNEALQVMEKDNKILVAKHRDSVEKERQMFGEKLKEQDRLLDEAKESIFQELRKEKQAILEGEKEIKRLKEENNSLQELLKKKDVELMNLKDILQKLTADREKMIEENDQVLTEIKHDLDQFVSEKISLVAELDNRKIEYNKICEENAQLQEDCETARTRLAELEHQLTNHDRINVALQNMVEDKRKLAYQNGVLQTENENLMSNVKAVERKVRELRSFALGKEKEAELLVKEREEAEKTTARVISEADQYERKYSKQIDSLRSALLQAKDDNKKLAGTLDAVITSHTQLQSSCETLQTELGKRDSRLSYLDKERSETETRIMGLNGEVESLKAKLTQQNEAELQEVTTVRETLLLLEKDREKLLKTVEPLMKTNRDLQESLEGLANELRQKNNEIKKLRASSVNVKKEMEIEAVALETKVDDVKKEFDTQMREVKKLHKREVTKLRKDFQEMVKLKNALKDENTALKTGQEEAESKQKKLKEKLRQTKNELDACLKLQSEQHTELETARDRINVMSHELAILEKLKSEYTQNNMEQARSLQEFISQLTDLQEEFRNLAEAQQGTSLLCSQKDDKIKREKMRRKDLEMDYYKLKNHQKQLKVKQDVTERQLEEVNYESEQVAVNLQEAHEWFKNKFANLQSELDKSRKIQSVLQQDNVDHHKALHEERKKAKEATEKAKEIIKSSRMMISRLVGQVSSTSQASRETIESTDPEKETCGGLLADGKLKSSLLPWNKVTFDIYIMACY